MDSIANSRSATSSKPWAPRRQALAAFAALALLGLGTAMASIKPISGVGFVIKKNPGGSEERVTTGPNGEFSFSNLGKGRYTLELVPPASPQPGRKVTMQDFHISVTRASTSSGSELHRLEITLKPGQGRPLQLEITRDGGQITGTVQGDSTLLQGTPPVTKGGATN